MVSKLLGLWPDEHLLASTAVSFRGAAAASTRSMFALASARARMREYDAWREHVEGAGFPAAGPEMVVGLTEYRFIVCRATFWLSRPAEVEAGISLNEIASVATTRHGIVTGMALALTNGAVVEVEAMLGRRLHRFARVLLETLAQRRR